MNYLVPLFIFCSTASLCDLHVVLLCTSVGFRLVLLWSFGDFFTPGFTLTLQ